MLTYRQYNPNKSLSRLIECYWVCRASATTMPRLEPLIPGGRIEVIFSFGNPVCFLASNGLLHVQTLRHAHVMGQRNRLYYAVQNGDTDLLGVRFKPGSISAFTKIPASALLNQIIPAEDVFDIDIKKWEELLHEKKTDIERIHLLDQFFSGIVKEITKECEICNKAVNAIRTNSVVSVEALCGENQSYYKKLERDFLKYVGYTPKNYSRIIRFNRALREVRLTTHSLTSISYDCNYYDQSHFIKDFREFAGTTPSIFRTEDHIIAGFLINHQSV